MFRTVTRDEAISKIVTLTSLSATDLEGFLAATHAEQEAMVAAYTTAGIVTVSAWSVILKILAEVVEIANILVPLEGAITGGIAIAQAAKGL
jgi:hypothetical protein